MIRSILLFIYIFILLMVSVTFTVRYLTPVPLNDFPSLSVDKSSRNWIDVRRLEVAPDP